MKINGNLRVVGTHKGEISIAGMLLTTSSLVIAKDLTLNHNIINPKSIPATQKMQIKKVKV